MSTKIEIAVVLFNDGDVNVEATVQAAREAIEKLASERVNWHERIGNLLADYMANKPGLKTVTTSALARGLWVNAGANDDDGSFKGIEDNLPAFLKSHPEEYRVSRKVGVTFLSRLSAEELAKLEK